MLTPKQLEDLPISMINLYSEVENDIIADMARRIAANSDFIPAAEWQYKKLIEMGMMQDEIIKKLSDVSGIRKSELENIIKKTCSKSFKADAEIFKKAGYQVNPLEASDDLKNIMNTGLESTNGLFENITMTTASTATAQFERSLDKNWLNINSGAFSPQESIKMSVKDLTDKGLEVVKYPSGRTDHIDVAVRRATITGVNQTALKLQDKLADEMDSDLVEVTAHSGARVGVGIANHAGWQGKVYSRSGKSLKYPSLKQETGFGQGAGLGGWNCRHSYFPFIEGVSEPTYTDSELKALNAPKYEYNGKNITEYEATQIQREIERNIRKYKREYLGMSAAGLPTYESSAKISLYQNRQDEFIKQTGLKRQGDKESINNFSRSQARKANYQAKALQSIEEDSKMKLNSKLPKKVSLSNETLKNTVNIDLSELHGVVPKGIELTDVLAMAGKDTSVPIKDMRRLHATYGGNISDWQKKSGTAIASNYKYYVHWYERNGFAPENEIKLKGVQKL